MINKVIVGFDFFGRKATHFTAILGANTIEYASDMELYIDIDIDRLFRD